MAAQQLALGFQRKQRPVDQRRVLERQRIGKCARGHRPEHFGTSANQLARRVFARPRFAQPLWDRRYRGLRDDGGELVEALH